MKDKLKKKNEMVAGYGWASYPIYHFVQIISLLIKLVFQFLLLVKIFNLEVNNIFATMAYLLFNLAFYKHDHILVKTNTSEPVSISKYLSKDGV